MSLEERPLVDVGGMYTKAEGGAGGGLQRTLVTVVWNNFYVPDYMSERLSAFATLMIYGPKFTDPELLADSEFWSNHVMGGGMPTTASYNEQSYKLIGGTFNEVADIGPCFSYEAGLRLDANITHIDNLYLAFFGSNVHIDIEGVDTDD